MQLDVHAEPALRTLERDLDVHLAHPGEDLLARLLVAAEPERRILLREATDRGRDLLLVAFRLGRDREAHDGLREAEVRYLDSNLLVGEEVARLRVLQLRDGAQVALTEVERRVVLLALDVEKRAHALLALRAKVHERRVGVHGALQHAEDVDAPCERVGEGLENERRDGSAVDVDRRALLRGRRYALDQEVEERVRAQVLRGDAARDWEDVSARHGGFQRGRDLVCVELLTLEVALHERLVRLDDRIEELLAILGCEVGQLLGDRSRLALLAALGARVGTHVEHVDDARQLVLGADRDMHGDALRRDAVAQGIESPEEVGALPVEHVHEHDPREA